MRSDKGPKIVGLSLLIAILLWSASIAFAQSSQYSWISPSGNAPLNWNYSSQREINDKNIGAANIMWYFTLSSAPPSTILSGKGLDGVTAPVLSVNGFAYVLTNFHEVIAIDSSAGRFLWAQNTPQSIVSSIVPGPYHDFLYTSNLTGRPLLWYGPDTYHMISLDGLTGGVATAFSPVDSDQSIGGNFGTYANSSAHFVVDEKRGILIVGGSTSGTTSDGRGFLRAIDVSSGTPRVLWTTFVTPPQDGRDQSWSLNSVRNMTEAWIFDGTGTVDLKKLPQNQLNSLLVGDWGKSGFDGTHSHAGAGFSWGSGWAIDEDKGLLYVGTSTPGPAFNATFRPGPNLWSDSVLAVNETSGRLIWGFQTTSHDVWGYDCSWGTALSNVNINGVVKKIVLKACKNGFLYALDGATGQLLWDFRQPDLAYSSCVLGSNGAPLHDPLNTKDMTANWACYPASSFTENPPDIGTIDSSVAYDPTANVVFFVGLSEPQKYMPAPVLPSSGSSTSDRGAVLARPDNASAITSTVYAVDASTGKMKWRAPMTGNVIAGGITVTGGLVIADLINSTLSYLAEDTGTVVGLRDVGGPLSLRPSVGADVSGNELLIFPSSSISTDFAPFTAGYIGAIGLPASSHPQSTSTTISSSTVGSTTGVPTSNLYLPIGVVVVAGALLGFLVVARRARTQNR